MTSSSPPPSRQHSRAAGNAPEGGGEGTGNGTATDGTGNVSASVTGSKAELVSVDIVHSPYSFDKKAVVVRRGGGFCSRRSRLEKFLMAATVILAIAFIAVVVVVLVRRGDSAALGNKEEQGGVCDTPGCVGAAHEILQNMDATADPCQDFYQFACGGYEKRIRIPDDRSTRSQFSLIGDELTEQLRDLLEPNRSAEVFASTASSSPVFQQVRDVYQACMDSNKLEELGLQPLRDLIRTLGGWPVVVGGRWNPNRFNWQDVNLALRRAGVSPVTLFSISIGSDFKNSSYRAIFFDQPVLGLGREYLVKGFNDSYVQYYYSYMQKAAILLGANPVRAARELRESLLFEMRLANISLSREERRNFSDLYHPMELGDLSDLAPIVDDWTEYLNTILTEEVMQVTPEERVIVRVPRFYRNLTSVLRDEPSRNVANYLVWRAVSASLGYLDSKAGALTWEYAKNRTGRTQSSQRWRGCLDLATDAFTAAVGKMYVQRHFRQEAKGAMVEMVADLKGEFKKMLDENKWMDLDTKKKAALKLSTIQDYIGYPDEMLDDANLEEMYRGIEVNSTEFLRNAQRLSVWSTNYFWSKLREKVDKTDWKRHANPAVVNAYYNYIENSIQFPAGILQGIFFSSAHPAYVNYGRIGWVIGHEITHGFDDMGRQFDHQGNMENWWNENTTAKFLEKTQCIITQYGNYSVEVVNMTLNGINTQGENIADNGGIKEAYRAYKRRIQREGRPDQSLPGLSAYNSKQLFWLSAANVWCTRYRPKALESQIKLGVHSPGRFRVNGPLSNSRDFAKDFKCPDVGAVMNPKVKCDVW